MKLISKLVPLIVLLFVRTQGFYLASPYHNLKKTLVTTRLSIKDCSEDDGRNNNKLSRRISSVKKSIASRFRPFGLGLVTAASVCSLSRTLVPTAHAVMPVLETSYDSADETAMKTVEAKLAKKREMERQERKRRAEEIEQTEGLKARIAYEKEYTAAKEQAEQELLKKMEKLRRSLLDQGLHPFLDIEGIQQDMLLRTGVDLSSIQGSDQYSDAKVEQMGLTKQTYSYQKKKSA